MTIATEILAQLGGNKFLAMTGAKNLVDTVDGLQFALPRASKGVKLVSVKLTADDTYSVQYFKVRQHMPVVIAESAMIYADNLAADFESKTGLYTSL